MDVSSGVVARRWDFLDALRGFALCGNLFVNAYDLLGGYGWRVGRDGSSVMRFIDLWVQGRFVPIFAYLFGVSGALLYAASLKRIGLGASRWLMVRRFSLLLVLGVAHSILLCPGDILTF